MIGLHQGNHACEDALCNLLWFDFIFYVCKVASGLFVEDSIDEAF